MTTPMTMPMIEMLVLAGRGVVEGAEGLGVDVGEVEESELYLS
jgi:hypothetical protein